MGASAQQQACAFCGALEGPDGSPLATCANCKVAAYCGEEHQKFDWKRHKMFCKTLLSKRIAALKMAQENLSAQPEDAQPETARNLAANQSDEPLVKDAYRNAKTSISSDASTSSAGSNQPSTSSECSSLLCSNSPNLFPQQMISTNAKAQSGSPEISLASCNIVRESLSPNVSADDPDIQIIENPELGKQRVVRKRPQQATRVIKDHLKNPIYNTTRSEHIALLMSDTEKYPVVTQYHAIALRMKFIADHVIKSLSEYGWAVVDNFYGTTHCQQTLREMESLYDAGLFAPGQLAERGNTMQAQDVRSDEIFWFDTNSDSLTNAVSIRLLISTIDSVTAHFRDQVHPYKICSRSRPMIACYPGNGARYVKHVDNPSRDGRCISSIYYCNENWDVTRDGGALRLYPSTSEIPVTIDPQGDRLVFFFSDCRNPHEVLPTYRQRFALTIWYYDRDEKDLAMVNRKIAKAKSRIDVRSAIPVETPKSEARSILTQESMEVAEPPSKWKIEKPNILLPASYPGQSSLLSGALPLFYANGFQNPNLAAAALCASALYQPNFVLSPQSLLTDVAPFATNLNLNNAGISGKSGLIIGSAPSAFMDARSDATRNAMQQALLQVDERLSV